MSTVTYEDYRALPDDGKRYEVIEGELCVVPAPNVRHQRILFNLTLIIGTFVKERKRGYVFFAPFDVVLSDKNVVQPDLLYVSNGRLNILTAAGAMGAPDLAVEVLSEFNRRHDEVTKLRLYESFGVEEYWMVDAATESVRVFRRDGAKLVRALEARESVETPLLPELTISVPSLFED